MIDDLEKNVVAAGRLGMAGITHRDATSTSAAVDALLAAPVRRPR